jgi:hypothetical protein
MKTHVILIGAAVLLCGAALSGGAQWDQTTRAVPVELDPLSRREYWGKFLGGKRALAIAVGTNRNPELRANLGLYVFDAHGNCVARDDDVDQASRDELAVEWLPAQTGLFTIQVKNLAGVSNQILLGIRQL